MNENLRNVKKQISDFLHHQKSMYLLWCFQLFFPDPTPPYCWRKEGRKNTIHLRLSLHTRKCLSSSWGWRTARGKGVNSWVSHSVLFIFYFISHFISLSLLYVREEHFHIICGMRNVKKQISDFLHHQKSMYLLWCFQLFFPDPTPPYCW